MAEEYLIVKARQSGLWPDEEFRTVAINIRYIAWVDGEILAINSGSENMAFWEVYEDDIDLILKHTGMINE